MTLPDDRINDAVRAHLDRDAATVDANAVLARVRDAGRSVPHRRAWLRRVAAAGVGTTLAAGIGGVLFFGPTPPTALASAEEILRESKTVHATAADRQYEVTVETDAAILRRLQLPAVVRQHRVWTRGDQFWIEPTADDAKWAMGQEPSGRIWFALNRKHGLVYESSEAGEPMARFCDMMSLRFVSTLAELLEQFHLARQDTGTAGDPIRIDAEIKPSFLNRNPRFRKVALVLDPTTKVIQSAVLTRRETATTLRFQLLTTGTLTDDQYELAGHLDADAEILKPSESGRPDRRAKFRDDFLKRVQSRVK